MTLRSRRAIAFGFGSLVLTLAYHADIAMSGELVLHSFCDEGQACGSTTGRPQGLIRDSGGNLYGVAGWEGAVGAGVIYRYSAQNYVSLYEFCLNDPQQHCIDGDGTRGLLVRDSNGNLYGTSQDGGATATNYSPGFGVIYELSPGATPPLSHLWQFCASNPPSCPEGSHPANGLTYIGAANGSPYDGSSALYGTTSQGGANGVGTVFKIAPGGSLTVIANFCSSTSCTPAQVCSSGLNCLPGATPNAVIADGNGNIYGTTQEGPDGSSNRAMLYKLTPSGTSYTPSILYTFCPHPEQNCPDGQQPIGPLTIDSSGVILGTTYFGGLHASGAIFAYPTTFFVKYSFCSLSGCADGKNPEGGVIVDASGNLYGTASQGGIYGPGGPGVAFKLGAGFQVLYSFGCSQPTGCLDAQTPESGVVVDGSGNLFGTTTFGGDAHKGALYEVTP